MADTMMKVGWYSAREATGTFDATTPYATGGIDLGLDIKPKHTVNITIEGGFIGEYDYTASKLKVYKSAGTEATAAELTGKSYRAILME